MFLREFNDYAVMRNLYMCRPVLNGEEIISWALDQGFKSVTVADDLHVTIAYSTKEIDWLSFMATPGTIEIEGGERELRQFGKATVLTLESAELHDRWQEIIDLGASWDHDEYRPHITLSYELPEGFDINAITPYAGKIILGSERIETLRDWEPEETSEKGE